MTPSEELKLQLIELCGSLEAAQSAFTWVVEVPPVVTDPAPVEGGVVLTDLEVQMNDPEGLWQVAMARLAWKQNNPAAEVK